MNAPTAERVRPGHRDRVGESPLWDASQGALWWVDIDARAIHRLRLASNLLQSWTLPERVACLALHADGGLVAGLETHIVHATLHDDGGFELATLASARHERADMRFNDGRCDRAGRFWVGTMVLDTGANVAAGRMHRLDALGLHQLSIAPMYTPNGLAFDPDGRGIWWSDSHPLSQRIWHAPLAGDGSVGAHRVVADLHDQPGRPDGAAIDVDGGYWICANDGGRVLRFTPDGRVDCVLAVPVSKPSMCSFGGDRLDTLFVTSIQPAHPQGDDVELAGEVFALRPGTQGLAETPFRPQLARA
jgi:sugar lactone lactonase YvrE